MYENAFNGIERDLRAEEGIQGRMWTAGAINPAARYSWRCEKAR